MKRLAEGVYKLDGFPPAVDAINCYLVGDVLVDAAIRPAARWVVHQLRGVPLSAHVLTHAHGDHQGASDAVCEAYGVPYWVGEADVPAAESGRVYDEMPKPLHPVPRFYSHVFPGPGRPVDRALKEGDTVADFTVLETPGHSAGHISLWRESDRTLVVGDVFTNMNVLSMMPGLHEPMPYFTPDPAQNRASMQRLADLRPALAVFGHGRPLRDPEALAAFTAGLPPVAAS